EFEKFWKRLSFWNLVDKTNNPKCLKFINQLLRDSENVDNIYDHFPSPSDESNNNDNIGIIIKGFNWTGTIQVSRDDKIADVKEYIRENYEIEIDEQTILYKYVILDNFKKIRDLNISSEETIKVILPTRVIEIPASSGDKVSSLEQAIFERAGICEVLNESGYLNSTLEYFDISPCQPSNKNNSLNTLFCT
ncbi:19964_t:CDS:2, partial [Dentiscutata erythropus]